jgi:lysophospholipase L1-like esterase
LTEINARRAALLFALALALAACGPKVPRLPALAPEAVILAFGDSLTYGSGASTEESYPAVLARLSARRVVNAGVPGEVSAEGLKRLPQLLEEVRPQLLILCHGGNDLLRRLDARATAENLRAMVELARRQGAAVVLVGVPAPGLLLPVPEFYRQIAEQYRLPYEGKIVSRIEGDRSLKADPIHPNAAGYRLLAERLARLLKDAGAL